MPHTYFANFPIVEYANNMTVDLMRRTAVDDGILTNARAMAPAEIRAGIRPDTVAARYYNDSTATWLVLLSTGSIDPWYDWYMSDDDLASIATSRYGSYEKATQLVRHYATNWAADSERQITPAGWSVLGVGEQKYWEPILGTSGRTVAYRRLREDWNTTTNMILNIVGVANTAFTIDEPVTISGSGDDMNAQVSWSNTTHASVRHLSIDYGSVNTTAYSTMVGATSNVHMNVTSTTVSLVIPAGEQQYWLPVTEWDHLVIENAAKRNVRLVDAKYLDQAQTELKQKLK